MLKLANSRDTRIILTVKQRIEGLLLQVLKIVSYHIAFRNKSWHTDSLCISYSPKGENRKETEKCYQFSEAYIHGLMHVALCVGNEERKIKKDCKDMVTYQVLWQHIRPHWLRTYMHQGKTMVSETKEDNFKRNFNKKTEFKICSFREV